MTGLHPVGAELGRMNKRILAERTGWPDGALEECEKLDAEFPEWSASWADGGGLTWREDGYYALPRRWRYTGPNPFLYGATVAALRVELQTHPAPEFGLAEYRPLQLPDRQES